MKIVVFVLPDVDRQYRMDAMLLLCRLNTLNDDRVRHASWTQWKRQSRK